jgi:hypothetical protein
MLRTGLLTPGTAVLRRVGDPDTTHAVLGKRWEGMLFWHVVRPDGTRISLRRLRDQARRRPAKPTR